MNLLPPQRVSAWLLTSYALLLAWLSLSPAAAPPSAYDKPLHVLAYCLFLLLGAPLARVQGAGFRPLAALAFAALGYGLALELGQGFVPGRVASLGDMIANAVGVALGLVILFRLRAQPWPVRQPAQNDLKAAPARHNSQS
jgi:VanZ family protein